MLSSCGTSRVVPITGRKQRVGNDDVALVNAILPIYKQEVSTYGELKGSQQAMVKRVANRLIAAAESYMKKNGYASDLETYKWETHLIKNKEVNAVCYPGGKILVYEGILSVTKNEAGLAAVMGHEIGHALAKHSSESILQSQWWKAIFSAGQGMLEGFRADNATKESITNLSAFGLELTSLKFSRKHEHEADHIGMILMAMAGYNPQEAPKVWERMTELYGDDTCRLLSTHPSNGKRMLWMREKWMSEAMTYYKPPKTQYTSKSKRTKTTTAKGRSKMKRHNAKKR